MVPYLTMVPYLWVAVEIRPDSMPNEVRAYIEPMGTGYFAAVEEERETEHFISAQAGHNNVTYSIQNYQTLYFTL